MYPQTLYPETRQVLNQIKDLEILKGFYLAGGTALALQIGHRKSIDLDLFTSKFPKRDLILAAFSKFTPKVLNEASGTLDMSIDGVKVSLLEYKYPNLEDYVEFENMPMASVQDISCMKLSAISSRGTKKDFFDLYFCLQKYSLSQLFHLFDKKFSGINYEKLHLLKSLVYFTDAEADPNPDLLIPTDWVNVKNQITKETLQLTATFGTN